MLYAYKIDVQYEPQLIRYTRDVEMPDRLYYLEDIADVLKKGEKFCFYEVSDSQFSTKTYMAIHGTRLETDDELKRRIAKEEHYNRMYDEYHKNKG